MGTYQSVSVGPFCTCSADISQIEIGGSMVGIAGLRGIFGAFHTAGRAPDPSLADELLTMAKVYNYVAPNSAAEYRDGLLREYTRYWNARLPHDSAVASAPGTGRATLEEGGPMARIVGIVRKLLKRPAVGSGVDR